MKYDSNVMIDIIEILLIMTLTYAYTESYGELEKLQHEAVKYGYATCVNKHFQWVKVKK